VRAHTHAHTHTHTHTHTDIRPGMYEVRKPYMIEYKGQVT
jgi:hypothetical protein